MAAALTVGMILQARAWCVNDQQVSVTTLHHRVDVLSGPVVTDVDFLNGWDTTFAPYFIGLIANGSKYYGSSMQILGPGPLGLLRTTIASQSVGHGGADRLPSQVSGLIRWGTNTGGRAYKGRIYLPFPSEEQNNVDGYPITGYLAGLDALGNEYVSHTVWGLSLGAQTIVPVLRHRKNKVGVIPAPTQISTWVSSNQWATQRKRGAFGRPNNVPF